MKRFYESPTMAVELFRVNESIAAGTCVARNGGGADEDLTPVTIACDQQGANGNHKSPDNITIFTGKNGGCNKQVDSLSAGSNAIAWTLKKDHLATLQNAVTDGKTYYFYS